jgi:hypothetical protein
VWQAFSCWSIHLLHLDTLSTLFVLFELCVVVARRCCCSSCVVRVVGWGCWFFSLHNLDLKLHFIIFLCTLRCVVRQSAYSPPVVHRGMCYNAFFCINKVILTFFVLILISKESWWKIGRFATCVTSKMWWHL